MSAINRFSLKQICRKRILEEMVRGVDGGYFAMVVDAMTLHIMSACCNVYDILDEGVSVVEMINKKRQALPKIDAVYFITPTVASVELLIQDFKNAKKPAYKSASIFFSGALGDNEEQIMKLIAQSTNLLSHMKSFLEFNLDFIAYEARAFHFATSTPAH
eukprot:Selendium_serpulae@DN5582_c0_g1_i2.p2